MSSTMPAERDLRRVIGDGDAIPDGEVEGLGEQELLALYRSMILLRTYDERSVVYHRQGRIGTYAIFWGHEAIQAGAFHALEDGDWIFPSYRESAIGLLRGMPAATILSWWRGHPAGWWNPADYNLASICVPIATQVPHAAGLAWGKRLRGETACALTFFGDGATSEGAFHEGANFAAVMHAPLVLLCNNNQWAISTPLSAQTKAEALVDKAAGYGIPGDARRRRRRARRLRGRARGASPAAERGRGRASSRPSPIAPRRTRLPTIRRRTSTSSGSRRNVRTSASAALPAISAARASSTTRSTSRSRPRPST